MAPEAPKPKPKETPKPKARIKTPEAQAAAAKQQAATETAAQAKVKTPQERKFRDDLQKLQKQKESFVAQATGHRQLTDQAYGVVKQFAESYPPETQLGSDIGKSLADEIIRVARVDNSGEQAVELLFDIGGSYAATGAEREHYANLIEQVRKEHDLGSEQIIYAARSLGSATQMQEIVVNRYADELIREVAVHSSDIGQEIQEAYEAGKQMEMEAVLQMQAAAVEEKKKEEKRREEKEAEVKAAAEKKAAEKAAAEEAERQRAELEGEETEAVQVGEGEAEVREVSVEPELTPEPTTIVYEAKAEPTQPVRSVKEAVDILQAYDSGLAGELEGLVRFINKKGDLNFRDLAKLETAINRAPEEVKQALLRLYGETLKTRIPDASTAVDGIISESIKDNPDPDQIEHGMKLAQELASRNTVTDRLRQGMDDVLDQMENVPEWREPVTIQAQSRPARPDRQPKGLLKEFESVDQLNLYLDRYEQRSYEVQTRDPRARLATLNKISEALLVSTPSLNTQTGYAEAVARLNLLRDAAVLEIELGQMASRNPFSSARNAEIVMNFYDERHEGMDIRARENFLRDAQTRLAFSPNISHDRPRRDELSPYERVLNTISTAKERLEREKMFTQTPRGEGIPADKSEAMKQYVMQKDVIEALLGEEDPDRAASSRGRNRLVVKDKTIQEQTHKALYPKSRQELKWRIEMIKKRQEKLEEQHQNRIAALGSTQQAERDLLERQFQRQQSSVKEIVSRLQRRDELYKQSELPLAEQIQRFHQEGVPVHQALEERHTEGSERRQLKLSDEGVRELIYDVLEAETSAIAKEKLETLRQKAKDLQGDERSLVNRILHHLEERARLLDAAVSPEKVTDYHFRQLNISADDVHRIDRLLEIDDLLENLKNRKNPKISWEDYWDGALETLNKVFISSDLTPNIPFDDSFNPLLEQPVYKQFTSTIGQAVERIRDGVRNGEIKRFKIKMWLRDPKTGEWRNTAVWVDDALELLYRKAIAMREFRQFTHNVAYIVTTRGNFEDLAKYTRNFKIETMENAMLGEREELTQEVSRYYVMEVGKVLADNNWQQEPTMFALREGRSEIDENVRDMLRSAYSGKDKKGRPLLKEWQINKALAEGSGISWGFTGDLLCLMALADAPRQELGYAGSAGDSLWGMMNYGTHHVRKWWQQGDLSRNPDGTLKIEGQHELAKLFFTQLREASYLNGWDPNQVIDEMIEHALDTRHGLKNTPEGYDMPFSEIANLFKIGPVIFRKSWRYRSALLHHYVPVEGNLVIDFVVVPADGKHDPTTGPGIKFWDNIDLDKTWNNIAKAGSSALLFYIDELTTAYKKNFIPPQREIQRINIGAAITSNISADELKHKLRRKVMENTLTRNPFKFIRLDPTSPAVNQREAPDSIRMQALSQMEGRQLTEKEFLDRKKEIDQWERDAAVITQRLVKFHLWDINNLSPQQVEDLRNSLGKVSAVREGNQWVTGTTPYRYDQAVQYWWAVQQVILQERMDLDRVVGAKRSKYFKHAYDTNEWLDFFAEQVHPYDFGSDDMDINQFRWTKAGDSLLPRAYGDAHLIAEKAVQPLFNISEILADASARKTDEEWLKYLRQAYGALVAVHGPHDAHKVVYKVDYLFIRYFDKDFRAQFPLGLGTLWGARQHIFDKTQKTAISLSRMDLGAWAWAWDESLTRTHINKVVSYGLLPPGIKTPGVAGTHDYNAIRLAQETGARGEQVFYDVSRDVVPMLFFLSTIALGGYTFKSLEEEAAKK